MLINQQSNCFIRNGKDPPKKDKEVWTWII